MMCVYIAGKFSDSSVVESIVMRQGFAMSRRPHKNDISIGEDRWITFGDLNNGQGRAIELDPFLTRVMPFLDLLETECVAACCGIDAYGLWPDKIKNAMATLNRQDKSRLISNLAQLQTDVDNMPADMVVSTRLNQFFHKGVFLEVLSHIRSVAEAESVGGICLR